MCVWATVPRWVGLGHHAEIERKLVGIKADLLCELASVSSRLHYCIVVITLKSSYLAFDHA